MNKKKLRILISSNTPYSYSGYASTLNEIYLQIRDEGYSLALSNFFGQEGYMREIDGITHYPKMNNPYGDDAMVFHGRDFKADIVISNQDTWPLDYNLLKSLNRWVPWVPIDHDPVPPSVVERMRLAYRIITCSKFGHEQLKNFGIHSTYIPYSVNTEIFKPLDKVALRKKFGLPADGFIFGMVAANKDLPPRKSFQEVMDAFKMFLQKHPDAYLYLNVPMGNPQGFPILEYAKILGIAERVLHNDNYNIFFKFGKDAVAEIINCFDVSLNPSISEGFGLNIIEAQSCFVAGTKYSTDTLKEWMQKPYSGQLIKIKTNKGSIECTPEHPFYTDKGWVKAGDLTDEYRLYYNSRYEEEGLYRGNIEEYGRIVEKPHDEGSSSNDGIILQHGSSLSSSAKSKKTLFYEATNEKPSFIKRATSLLSRINRRRWTGNNTFNEWWEMETLSFNNRRFGKTNEISSGNNNNSFILYREEEKRALSISHSGNIISAILPKYTSIFNNKEGQNGIGNQVERNPSEQNQTGKINKETREDSQKNKTFEFAKITSIRKRQVQDILVYNTRTGSNTYLANGFLVHNCGVPVIVNDFTSMPELIVDGETGWKSKVAHKRFTHLSSYVGEPDTQDLYEKMELAYKADRKVMGEKARKHIVENYDSKLVYTKHWSPYLAKIEAEIYSATDAPDKIKQDSIDIKTPTK